MATTFKNIKGIKIERNIDGYDVRESASLELTSYWGGNDRGKCLQLTTKNDHVQLTRDQVKELMTSCLDFLSNEHLTEL